MKTILDEGYSWFLEKILYQDELELVLVEARLGIEQDLDIGDIKIEGVKSIETCSQSRVVKIKFENAIAWQCLNESYSSFDEYEERDKEGKLQVITRSRYLDYVNKNHGWYEDVTGDTGCHYRIWTEDEVIDVVSTELPKIEWVST